MARKEEKDLGKELKDRKKRRQLVLMANLMIEMLTIIGIFTWLGIKADQHFHHTKPYLAVLFIFFSVLLSLFYAFSRINKKDK